MTIPAARSCRYRWSDRAIDPCSCRATCARVAPVEPMAALRDAERRYDVMPDSVREWLSENATRWAQENRT